MPDVTILLPAGDDVAKLGATVRNLLAQSFADFELLIVIPGQEGAPPAPRPAAAAPAEEEAAVANEIIGVDPRVRVVEATGAGLGAALNHGVEVAEGGLIVRVTPGDISAPERLARQTAILHVAPEVSFVGTGWQAIGADGSVHKVVNPPPGDAALRAAMTVGDAIGHPTAMMRRDAIVRAGSWRPAFAPMEDYDLLLRLMDRHRGACTSEVLVETKVSAAHPGWRALEQQILSEMGALAARDRRQAGRPDHGERELPIDRSLLHRMGLVEEEIAQGMIARALAMATAAGTAGQWRAMREAARLGLQQKGLSKRFKSQFLGLWVRSLARIRPAIEGVAGRDGALSVGPG